MKLLSIFFFFILTTANTFSQSVSGGRIHTLAICENGTAKAWGYNHDGQLGDSTTTFTPLPHFIFELDSVIAIAGGNKHSLALLSDGTVRAWGHNADGQLGDNSTNPSLIPVQVSGLTDVVAISAGWYHNVVLKSDGSLWSWGNNDNGELGDGSQTESHVPVAVGLTGVVAISCGPEFTLAIDSAGFVWGWGNNLFGAVGDSTHTTIRMDPVSVQGMTDVVEIAAGYWHSMALKSDGTLWSWGNNFYGQLGNGMTNDTGCQCELVPQMVLASVSHIAAGLWHSLAVMSDSTVKAWGYNNDGQLGDNSTNDHSTPAAVLTLNRVVSIDGGGWHSMALRENGDVWAWGDNFDGEIGNGSFGIIEKTPQEVIGLCSVPIGIEEADADDFNLFPNPSNGKITILTNSYSDKIKLEILNFEGRIVFSEIFSGDRCIINPRIAPGIYFVRVKGTKSTMKKIVIQ